MVQTVYYYKQDGTLTSTVLTDNMLNGQVPVVSMMIKDSLVSFYWSDDCTFEQFVEQTYLISEGKELADIYMTKFLVFYVSEEVAKEALETYKNEPSYLELVHKFNAINLIFEGRDSMQAQFGTLPTEIESAVSIYRTMLDLGSTIKVAEAVSYQPDKETERMDFEDFYNQYAYLGSLYMDFHERLGV